MPRGKPCESCKEPGARILTPLLPLLLPPLLPGRIKMSINPNIPQCGSLFNCHCGNGFPDSQNNLECSSCELFYHGACYNIHNTSYLSQSLDNEELFVCGPCSVEKDVPCSNTTVKIFYKNRDRLELSELEDFKHQALLSRILQSLRTEEHLNFSGYGETFLLKMVRFKLGVCEKEAVKLLEKLISDRVVHLDADNKVHVHQEVIHKITGAQSWLVNLVDPAFQIIVQTLGVKELKKLRECCATIRDRIDRYIDTFSNWNFNDISCSDLMERVGVIRTIQGITVRKLRGDPVNCDKAVELLVDNHKQIKNVQIGDDVNENNITDKGLQALLTAHGLTELSLSSAPLITGETLQLCPNSAQQIQHLALRCCSLTDRGLLKVMRICGILQLISLELTGSSFTGGGLNALQDKFSSLKILNLCGCDNLTDQGLLNVLKMAGTNLQDLDISSTNITGLGLEELEGKFSNLKTLNLSCCRSLTDQGLLNVLKLAGTDLQDLNISETNITVLGLEELEGKFSSLKTLNLSCCESLEDQGLLNVLKMAGTDLQDLNISETNITGLGLEELEGKFPNLNRLNLLCCESLEDQGLLNVLKLAGTDLQDLNILGKNITGLGLEELEGKFSNLKILNLSYCRSLTNQGLLNVLKMAGTDLQDLNISRTNITGLGLEELEGKFSNMKKLRLSYNLSLTDQGLSEIINITGPLLETVFLQGSNISTQVKNEIKLRRPNLTFKYY